MSSDNLNKVAFYIAGGSVLFCVILLSFFSLHFTAVILIAILTGILFFFLSRYLITLYIVPRIENISKDVILAIRNEPFKNRLEIEQLEPLQKLETAVRRLIREKTLEIYNLKELERLRKEFLGDVAHELRSPVFNIQGYLHTLLEGAMHDENVSARFLNKAARHADHLSSLVEDLVTITRIESGELKLEYSNFDLKELIAEVLELQDLNARQKNISLEPRFDPQPALIVHADRQKIKQVLMNLISNSIKYGTLDGHTHINLSESSQTVTVEVADNGEGIEPEHLPRIFERFYRVDKSRSHKDQPSSGLGLAIVKHFIEAHGQKVLVTSRPGIGSIFSFSLEKGIKG